MPSSKSSNHPKQTVFSLPFFLYSDELELTEYSYITSVLVMFDKKPLIAKENLT